MNTGNIANWDGDILDIGPIYPFVGWEGTMVVIAVIFWIGWHILQIRMENRAARRRGATACARATTCRRRCRPSTSPSGCRADRSRRSGRRQQCWRPLPPLRVSRPVSITAAAITRESSDRA